MVTQIYGIMTVEDALASVGAGADNIGIVTFGNSIANDHVSTELAKAIFAAMPARVKKLAILDLGSGREEEIFAMARELRPDILHLSGKLRTGKAFYRRFKAALPGMELMQAIPMTGPEAYDLAAELSPFCDYFILDSVKPGAGGVGAAGVTHDWAVSQRIVGELPNKVILAGGLGPENVAAAIEAVRPYGVDSLTRTSHLAPDGSFLGKDIDRVREFCRIAHTY